MIWLVRLNEKGKKELCSFFNMSELMGIVVTAATEEEARQIAHDNRLEESEDIDNIWLSSEYTDCINLNEVDLSLFKGGVILKDICDYGV